MKDTNSAAALLDAALDVNKSATKGFSLPG
jgi:hypothetical protein